ncbi:MAG: iron dependent repressor, metal binding and dimerization domain protein, partial [Planctomycetota bacterium]|nr:iron dependent repressor, metal binding and dimerization domain protein [Planctomycetota bacterium]
MLEAIGGSAGQLRKTLKLLQDKRWLEPFDGRWQLTEEGNMEAQRLLRAHRLWETYLDQVGMPAERVHETAERLEHVHDESAVDYLDDKLGHPLVDPHGSEIPEDVQRLQSGEGIKLSFLREGYRVQVVRLLPCESRTSKITQGLVLSVGTRTDDHEHWRVCTEDQTWFDLDHQAADSVEVRVVGYLPPSS